MRGLAQGRPEEAILYLEKALFLRKELYGVGSQEVQISLRMADCDCNAMHCRNMNCGVGQVSMACEQFTAACNTLAMVNLQRDDFMTAYELLKKGEVVTCSEGSADEAWRSIG